MSSTTAPERPITRSVEDRLERGGFVRRLVEALVDPVSRRSRGVVIGLTGPWGSGKSSVLNLLEAEARQQYKHAIIVRFDPWLVSGRDDLISEFFGELLATLEASRSGGEGGRSVAVALARYADALSPAVKGANGVAGGLLEGTLKALHISGATDDSLNARRRRLLAELRRVKVPIVVLIDELDRVEEAEVRTIAQLVRAVADFPQISYLLAYDHERVVQALGGDGAVDPDERAKRGLRYLEKIVQHAIPLPWTFVDEIKDLVLAELSAISDGALPKDFAVNARFRKLLDDVCGSVLGTPRDVKRAIGSFRILRSMTMAEVDWVDLLGYAILSAKAPGLVEAIRRDPERFVDDPLSEAEMMRRVVPGDPPPVPWAAGEQSPAVEQLLMQLFPAIRDHQRRLLDSYADPISSRRSLLAVLRLGLRSGEISRDEVAHLLESAPLEEVATIFRRTFESGGLGSLIDRIDDLYPDHSDPTPFPFWSGAMRYFSRTGREPDVEIVAKRDAAHSLTITLGRAAYKEGNREIARRVFFDLYNRGDLTFAPELLRRHFFAYGLYENRNDGNAAAFLDRDETTSIAEEAAERWRALHMSRRLIGRLVSPHAIFVAVDLGMWDDSCQSSLTNDLSPESSFDDFILMMFGGSSMVERDYLRRIVDIQWLIRKTRKRLSEVEGRTERATLSRALQGVLEGV